jgi:uncharacterized SAM-binding protein YcdF (DUF218 family)
MYHSGEIQKIIVSGKWTIWYDWLDITPPTTEARLMKDYLVANGVGSRDILQETLSKDTIGNLYYSKQLLNKNRTSDSKIVIVCATQRLDRVRFMTENLFGDDYAVSYEVVDAPGDIASSLGTEEDIFAEQKKLISALTESFHKTKGSIYQLPYYTDQASAVRAGARKNELVD